MCLWKTKLEYLLEGQRRSKGSIETMGGLNDGIFRSKFAQDDMGATVAVIVARTLGVTVEWLFDPRYGLDTIESQAAAMTMLQAAHPCTPAADLVEVLMRAFRGQRQDRPGNEPGTSGV